MHRMLNAILDKGLYLTDEKQLYHFINIYAKKTKRSFNLCINEMKKDVNQFVNFMHNKYKLSD